VISLNSYLKGKCYSFLILRVVNITNSVLFIYFYSKDKDEPPEEYTSTHQLISFFKAVSPVIQVGPRYFLV